MESAGFARYQYEWWHFDIGDIFWSRVTGKKALFGPLYGDNEWDSEIQVLIEILIGYPIERLPYVASS